MRVCLCVRRSSPAELTNDSAYLYLSQKTCVIDVSQYSSWSASIRSFDVPFTDTILEMADALMMNLTSPINSNVSIANTLAASIHDDEQNSDSPLVRYRTLYRNYHGILSSIVCVFGLTCNLFNIIVLTRPTMRSSTNTILTSLAISDLLKMSFVLPASILFYCLPISEHKSEPDPRSYFQVKFYMMQMLFTLTLHCISTW
jgi:hypothetical protein